MRIVRKVVGQISELRPETPVVLKSTVPPGTTEDLARQWPSVPLVFCPEFLRERYYREDSQSPVRVVLGWSRSIGEDHRAIVREVFARRFANVPLVELSSVNAKLLKYAENALFGVKVSFANEMVELAKRPGRVGRMYARRW